jgi:hypothetical protein
MSTFVDLLPRTLEDEAVDAEIVDAEAVPCTVPSEPGADSDLDSYADDQIRGLVWRLFLPGWPKPCHQVVFSGVDAKTDLTALCTQVGEVLASQACGSVCVVEAIPCSRGENQGHEIDVASSQKKFGALRDSSLQLASRLWLMPREVFLNGHDGEFSMVWLRSRLAELRLEFDYTILQGPAASAGSAATMLGAQCDGLVMVVEANSTRRPAAQKVKEELHAANARLLGTVLSERTFPIPRALYSRL